MFLDQIHEKLREEIYKSLIVVQKNIKMSTLDREH